MTAFETSLGLVRRAKRAAQRYGIIGMLPIAAHHLLHLASRLRPSIRAQIEHRRTRAAEFDRQFGVETSALVYQTELKSDNPNQLHAKRYEASDPEYFRKAMEVLPTDFRDFVFIDFGSGKGRALLLATEFPFKRIIGVEFAEELHRIAEDNIQRFRGNMSKCKDVQAICMDALKFPLPEDARLLCYFGDPFDEPLMAEMLMNIQNSLSRAPRDVFIVYYNPRSGHLFDRASDFKAVTSIGPVRVWRAILPHP
jgi:SAM-dependent methyltransferase